MYVQSWVQVNLIIFPPLLDLILSALLDQSCNLPSFIKSSEHLGVDYKDVICNIMEVFEILLTKYKDYMTNYFVKIKVFYLGYIHSNWYWYFYFKKWF